MPSKSKSQFRYVQMMRSQNPDKKSEWYWEDEWTDVDYDSLPEKNKMKRYKPLFKELKNVNG